MEGSGTRTELQLTANVDKLFDQAPDWEGLAWSWAAEMPAISGVDFWNDSESHRPTVL